MLRHETVWRLAGPLIISNVSVAVLGMVDTAVVGHLPEAYYLGAVTVAAVIFNFLYWGMGFLRMGATGIVAQIHGRGDADAMRTSLLHSGAIALVAAALFLIMQHPIALLGLYLIGGSDEVLVHARIYFDWAIWGAPAVLLSLSLMGWLLGLQNARATLFIAVVTNVVNIILDFVFVFVFEMDVKGVALASVVAQYSGLLLGLILVRRELKAFPGHWLRSRILDFDQFRSMLVLNRNILIRTLCIIFAFAFFTRQGAAQGDLVLAANAILLNFLMFISLSLDGFANAAEALVGKAIGAADRKALKEAVITAGVWSLIIASGLSISYLVLGEALINLMTDIDAVRDVAGDYLPWVMVAPLIGVWCYLLDGIFIGATRGEEMRDTLLISTFAVFLPAWYGFRFLDNHGLWLAMMLFFLARGLTLAMEAFRIERHKGGFIPGAV
ncbi:MAG: MATE family efflux transporter [Gammaproteobacteria bacterium]